MATRFQRRWNWEGRVEDVGGQKSIEDRPLYTSALALIIDAGEAEAPFSRRNRRIRVDLMLTARTPQGPVLPTRPTRQNWWRRCSPSGPGVKRRDHAKERTGRHG